MTDGEKRVPRGVKVAPTSRAAIREMTEALRHEVGEPAPFVDVADLIERKLYVRYGIVLAPKSEDVLGADEGRSYPDRGRIELRDDVYEALVEGQPRARFTAMHEVGHVFQHAGVALLRTAEPGTHDYHEDSEWQADAFAGEFLMPLPLIRAFKVRTAATAAALFGVSLGAAVIRFKVLKAEGEIRMT